MFIVTGGAGFIGSNLVHALNGLGHDDIIVVDDLTDGHRFRNLATASIADYLDHADFRERLAAGAGFLYPLCGTMRTMPGLGSKPALEHVDLDADGNVVGLF